MNAENIKRALRATVNYRIPSAWPAWLIHEAYRRAERYVGRHGGAAGERSIGLEEQGEVVQRVIVDVVTSEPIPVGVSVARHLYRALRLASVRRWYDTSTGRKRPDAAGAEPFSGSSMDSRSATPNAIVSAAEQAARGNLRSVPDRQRRLRRRLLGRRNAPHRFEVITERGPDIGDRCRVQFVRVEIVTMKHRGCLFNNPASGPAVRKNTVHACSYAAAINALTLR